VLKLFESEKNEFLTFSHANSHQQWLTERFCVKNVLIRRLASLSPQMHSQRFHVWLIDFYYEPSENHSAVLSSQVMHNGLL